MRDVIVNAAVWMLLLVGSWVLAFGIAWAVWEFIP